MAVAEQSCLWYGTWRTDTVRVVLVGDTTKATGYDIALVTTDLSAASEQIITRYAARWSVEVTFFDAKNTSASDTPATASVRLSNVPSRSACPVTVS